jgi:hypothetical protein
MESKDSGTASKDKEPGVVSIHSESSSSMLECHKVLYSITHAVILLKFYADRTVACMGQVRSARTYELYQLEACM